jgi:hypothetical protein
MHVKAHGVCEPCLHAELHKQVGGVGARKNLQGDDPRESSWLRGNSDKQVCAVLFSARGLPAL